MTSNILDEYTSVEDIRYVEFISIVNIDLITHKHILRSQAM